MRGWWEKMAFQFDDLDKFFAEAEKRWEAESDHERQQAKVEEEALRMSREPQFIERSCLRCQTPFVAVKSSSGARSRFCSSICYDTFRAYKYSTPLQAEGVSPRQRRELAKLADGFALMGSE